MATTTLFGERHTTPHIPVVVSIHASQRLLLSFYTKFLFVPLPTYVVGSTQYTPTILVLGNWLVGRSLGSNKPSLQRRSVSPTDPTTFPRAHLPGFEGRFRRPVNWPHGTRFENPRRRSRARPPLIKEAIHYTCGIQRVFEIPRPHGAQRCLSTPNRTGLYVDLKISLQEEGGEAPTMNGA